MVVITLPAKRHVFFILIILPSVLFYSFFLLWGEGGGQYMNEYGMLYLYSLLSAEHCALLVGE